MPTSTARLILSGTFSPCFGQQLIEARQILHRRPADHVIERQHRVGLAAAEVGLQLDDRIAARARQPLGGADQQVAQAVGQIGAAEEFARIAVLGRRAAVVHLGEIGRELGLLEFAGRNVLVRLDHFAPRQQARDRLDRDVEALRLAPLLDCAEARRYLVRRIVSRILPISSAVSPALIASISRRIVSSARSASS